MTFLEEVVLLEEAERGQVDLVVRLHLAIGREEKKRVMEDAALRGACRGARDQGLPRRSAGLRELADGGVVQRHRERAEAIPDGIAREEELGEDHELAPLTMEGLDDAGGVRLEVAKDRAGLHEAHLEGHGSACQVQIQKAMSATTLEREGMHMPLGLDHLLSRVVERKGYTIQGADKEALFAKKGDDVLLAAWKLDAALTPEDAQMFLAAIDQLHATTGVLVCPRGADDATKALLATAKGVEMWTESRIIVEVGDALLKDAIEASVPIAPKPMTAAQAYNAAALPAAPVRNPTKFPSLVSQAATASSGSGSGVAYFMPNKKKEQPIDMQGTISQAKGGSLNYAWGGMAGAGPSSPGIATRLPSKPSVKTDQWGNVVKGAAAGTAPAVIATDDVEITATPRRGTRQANPAATGAAPPVVLDANEEAYEIITTKKEKPKAVVKDASTPSCTTLKVNVSKDEAVAKVGKPGTAKLALVPHVAFEYHVEMSRPGMTAPVTGDGAVLINSLTGDLRSVEGGLAWNPSEPTDASRKDAEKLTAVDVYDKVKGFMAKTFTKTLNVEKEVAGNTVSSTLKLTPEPDEMGLDHKGIVYVPTWEITTSTGVVKVDGFTGAVL